MELHGLASIRNDADIVESWVRHHLRVLDRLHVVVHSPEDGTDEVLKALVAEGLPLDLTFHFDPAYPQSSLITRAARRLKPAYVFLLDADEFIRQDRPTLESALSGVQAPAAYTFLQTYLWQPNELNEPPLAYLTHRLTEEGRATKLVLTPEFWNTHTTAIVSDGNHWLYNCIADIPDLPVQLAHFPVRSNEQMRMKTIIGTLAKHLVDGTDRRGVHWGECFQKLEDMNVEPVEWLHGNSAPAFDIPGYLLRDPLPQPDLRYRHYARTDAFRALALFAEKLIERSFHVEHDPTG